jgi:hypothetical protein
MALHRAGLTRWALLASLGLAGAPLLACEDSPLAPDRLITPSIDPGRKDQNRTAAPITILDGVRTRS